jgi:hypothetical protein
VFQRQTPPGPPIPAEILADTAGACKGPKGPFSRLGRPMRAAFGRAVPQTPPAPDNHAFPRQATETFGTLIAGSKRDLPTD